MFVLIYPFTSQIICINNDIMQRFTYDEIRACLHQGGGPQVGEVICGGSPHLSCKRDHIKMRDYKDRRVTPPKRVTSPTWGPPPPCKQALNRDDFLQYNGNQFHISEKWLELPLNRKTIFESIFFCNLHDLSIEFSACLERHLLKRRTTVTLSDLASRTYAGVELICGKRRTIRAPILKLIDSTN